MPSLKCGIIGMPNVGKSTLFNALLKKRVALSANYPFATIEPNTGVVAVPDPRLATLADVVKREEHMENPPPIIPAVVEFVDIAGLVKGASTGAGLGNQFLSHIREVDAIIHVLRDFEDPSASSGQVPIIREGSVNPKEDREIVETELALADLQVLEKIQNSKLVRSSFRGKIQNDNSKLKNSAIEKIYEALKVGKMASRANLTKEELLSIKDLQLLTEKPILYVFNVDEGSYAQRLEDKTENENEMVISAKIEEELADLPEQERLEYLREIGIGETGLERLIKKAYALLGLISFLTAGKKEVRAWTIKKGTKAPTAAGVIHTDFEKGFIRAQVIEYEKLIEAGSMKSAREKGWVRTEGKDYEIKDGDVVEFLVGN